MCTAIGQLLRPANSYWSITGTRAPLLVNFWDLWIGPLPTRQNCWWSNAKTFELPMVQKWGNLCCAALPSSQLTMISASRGDITYNLINQSINNSPLLITSVPMGGGGVMWPMLHGGMILRHHANPIIGFYLLYQRNDNSFKDNCSLIEAYVNI